MEALTWVAIAGTAVAVALTLKMGFKSMPIRPVFDWARLGVQAGLAVLIPVASGVTTPLALIVGAVPVGVLVGFMQGQQLDVRVENAKLVAQRSATGFAIWGGGIVLVQIAAVASRSGLVQIGLGISWFSIGIGLGLIGGRAGKIKKARHQTVGAAAVAGVALLFIAGPTGMVLSQDAGSQASNMSARENSTGPAAVSERQQALAVSFGLSGLLGQVCNQLGYTTYSTSGCKTGSGDYDAAAAYVSTSGITGSGQAVDVGETGVYYTFPPGEYIHYVEFDRCGLTGLAVDNSQSAALGVARGIDAVIVAECPDETAEPLPPAPSPSTAAPPPPREPAATTTTIRPTTTTSAPRSTTTTTASAPRSTTTTASTTTTLALGSEVVAPPEIRPEAATSGPSGGHTITPEEALATALAGLVAAAAAGLLSVADASAAGEALIDASSAGGQSGGLFEPLEPTDPGGPTSSGRAATAAQAPGVTGQPPPTDTIEPPLAAAGAAPVVVAGAFEPLDAHSAVDPPEAGSQPCQASQDSVDEWRPRWELALAEYNAATDMYALVSERWLDDWKARDTAIIVDFALAAGSAGAALAKDAFGDAATFKDGFSGWAEGLLGDAFPKSTESQRQVTEILRTAVKTSVKGQAKGKPDVAWDTLSKSVGSLGPAPSGLQKSVMIEKLAKQEAQRQLQGLLALRPGMPMAARENFLKLAESGARTMYSNFLKTVSLLKILPMVSEAWASRDALSQAVAQASAELRDAEITFDEAARELHGYQQNLRECLEMNGLA